MAEEERVTDVMEKKVLTIDGDSSVRECAKLMAKRGASSAVVLSRSSAVGIVTERDLVVKVMADNLNPSKVLVKDIMSTPLITVEPGASITDAAKLMTEYKIRRLVVADKEGRLAGIVTASGLAKTMARKKGYKDPTLNAIARFQETPTGGPYQ